MTNLTSAMVLLLIAKAEFRNFSKGDTECFAGVESPDAQIHYGDEYTIILDGNRVCFIDSEGVEAQFQLGENIFAC